MATELSPSSTSTTPDDKIGEFSTLVNESVRESVKSEIEQLMVRDKNGKQLPFAASPLEIGRAVGPGIGMYFQLNMYFVIATFGAAILCVPSMLYNSSYTMVEHFTSVSRTITDGCNNGQSTIDRRCDSHCVGKSFLHMTSYNNTFENLACRPSGGVSRLECIEMCARYNRTCEELYTRYPKCRDFRNDDGDQSVSECMHDLYHEESRGICNVRYECWKEENAAVHATDRLCFDRLAPQMTESTCSALRTFLRTDRRYLSGYNIRIRNCFYSDTPPREINRFEIKFRSCSAGCTTHPACAADFDYQKSVDQVYSRCIDRVRELEECDRLYKLQNICPDYLDSSLSRRFCADQCYTLAGSVRCADGNLVCLAPSVDASHFAMGVDVTPIARGATGAFLATVVLVFFIVSDIFINVKMRLAVEEHDVSVASPSDYAVLIRNIPTDATKEELHSYSARFGKVAGVHLLNKSNRVSTLAQDVLRSRYNVERVNKLLAVATKVATGIESTTTDEADTRGTATPAANPTSPALRLMQDRVSSRHASAIESLAAANDAQRDTDQVVAALVVFETREAQQLCVASLPNSLISRLCKRDAQLRLRGSVLLVSRAPEPEDIMYHNIRPPFEKLTRKTLATRATLVSVYAALIISVVIIQVAAAVSAVQNNTDKLACEHFKKFYQADITCDISDSQGIAVFSSFLNFVVATLLADNIIKRSHTMKSYSNTERLSRVLDDTVFVHFAISCVIPIAFHGIYYAGGYSFKGMLVDIVSRQILVDSFMSIAKLVITHAIDQGRRLLAGRRATSADELRAGTSPTMYNPLSAYVELLKLLNLMLSWVVLVPWSVYAVLASMIGHGMIQRFLLLRFQKRPVAVSATIAGRALIAIRAKVFYGFLFAIVIVATVSGSAGENDFHDKYYSSLANPDRGIVSSEAVSLVVIGIIAMPLIVAFFVINQLVKESIFLYSKLLALPTRLILQMLTRKQKHTAGVTEAAPPDIQQFVALYAPPNHSDWVECIEYAVSHKLQTVTEALSAKKAKWHLLATHIDQAVVVVITGGDYPLPSPKHPLPFFTM